MKPTVDHKRNSDLSTGDVAKYCGVCRRTVVAWIDLERLVGYRVPHSDHRRVARDDLKAFMLEHDYPPDMIERVK